MSKPTDMPHVHRLSLQDGPPEDLFASPESGATTQKHTPTSNVSSAQKQQHARSESRHNAEESHNARLRAELERVREVNRVIEGLTASLTKAKGNMQTVHATVNSAGTLLATWTRVLSQSEHNQRLILNPNWHGATQDLEDMEGEEARRQQEAERRVVEEQRRREEALRRAEEEERRREAASSGGGRGSKTRGTRAGASRGYVGVGGQTGHGRGPSGSTRGGSGTGRGARSTRGRGRG